MKTDRSRALYDKASDELLELVQFRSRALRDLARISFAAADILPSSGMLVEFRVERAKQLLSDVEALAPQIAAAVDRVNGLAEKIGKPQV